MHSQTHTEVNVVFRSAVGAIFAILNGFSLRRMEEERQQQRQARQYSGEGPHCDDWGKGLSPSAVVSL